MRQCVSLFFRYLRCFAENGENVFLPHDLRGNFSAVAKEDNISGVHTAANLLNKRLPVMARLVPNPSASSTQNQIPVTSNNGGTLKTTSTFANEMRMLAALDEDFIVGLVLSQGNKECNQVVPIPLPALIKVHSPSNHEDVCKMPEFERLVERCQELSQDIVDKMTVHDIGYARDLRLSSDKGSLVHNLMGGGNPSGGTGTNPGRIQQSGSPDSASETETVAEGSVSEVHQALSESGLNITLIHPTFRHSFKL